MVFPSFVTRYPITREQVIVSLSCLCSFFVVLSKKCFRMGRIVFHTPRDKTLNS
jgi:hypothetical protein